MPVGCQTIVKPMTNGFQMTDIKRMPFGCQMAAVKWITDVFCQIPVKCQIVVKRTSNSFKTVVKQLSVRCYMIAFKRMLVSSCCSNVRKLSDDNSQVNFR